MGIGEINKRITMCVGQEGADNAVLVAGGGEPLSVGHIIIGSFRVS